MVLESMASSIPLTAGAGLEVRNLPASVAERVGVDDGGFGRKDCTRKLNA